MNDDLASWCVCKAKDLDKFSGCCFFTLVRDIWLRRRDHGRREKLLLLVFMAPTWDSVT